MITFTKVALPYGWLGNMSPHPVIDTDIVYPTAEHYFQLLRLDPFHKCRARVLATKSPMAAKLIVKTYLPEDAIVRAQSVEDLNNMRRTLRLKFGQHIDLAEQLLATGEQYIIEDVTERQNKGAAMFWGAVPVLPAGKHANGKNMLGVLLMELRRELRA